MTPNPKTQHTLRMNIGLQINNEEDCDPPTCPICDTPFFFGYCTGCEYDSTKELSSEQPK